LVKLHKEAEVDLHGEGGLIHLEPIFTDVEILFDYVFVENVNITACLLALETVLFAALFVVEIEQE
jgi:hypothetical protein